MKTDCVAFLPKETSTTCAVDLSAKRTAQRTASERRWQSPGVDISSAPLSSGSASLSLSLPIAKLRDICYTAALPSPHFVLLGNRRV